MLAMSAVIEIIDSDEDTANQAEKHCGHSLEPLEINCLKELREKELTQDELSHSFIKDKTRVSPVHRQSLSCSPLKSRRRHRRKSAHQPMRANPDVQFETISLEDEEDASSSIHISNPQHHHSPRSNLKPILSKKSISILSALSAKTEEPDLSSASEDFFANGQVNSVIRQIAAERVRINYLLTSYGMPDINFSLYTQYEKLNFQFEDRLKQRKIRSWNVKQKHGNKPEKLGDAYF